MTFARPALLWLAVALPAIIVLALVGYYRRRRRAARLLGEIGLIARLGGAGLDVFPTRRLLLLTPAALLIGLAAAGPQWGTRVVETHGRSIDLVLVLDVSKSMLARDLEPSRLERQRLFVSRLIRELAGDRIGLVAFAGRAYTLSPLTTDHSALQLYVDALDPEIVSQGGSSLAAAIEQGIDLVRGQSATSRQKVLILASDGEALEVRDAVRSAAQRAANYGITIHTVGIGTDAGAPIPETDPTGYTLGYKRDPETGEVVISRLDEELLREVARSTGGVYIRSDRAGATDALLDRVRGLERSAAAGGTRQVPNEQFAWFIAAALALIAADTIRARRGAGKPAAPGTAARTTSSTTSPARAHTGTNSQSARIVALLAILTAVSAFGIGDLERGNRLYRQGRYAEAVEAYRAALRDGNESPTLHYNLGTALLRLGKLDEAEQHLRAALASIDPEQRERTLYNLGNRYLEEGLGAGDPEQRRRLLDAAVDAYRDALRLDPGDLDAKWNLELALREQQQQPPPQQGGQQQQQQDQQGQNDDPQGDQDQQQNGPPPASSNQDFRPDERGDPGEMTREEAERLLGAIEQAERELQRSKLKKGRRDTPVARDW